MTAPVAAFAACVAPTAASTAARSAAACSATAGAAPARGDRPPAGPAEEGRFLRRACRAGVPLAVLDIPLLFETGGRPAWTRWRWSLLARCCRRSERCGDRDTPRSSAGSCRSRCPMRRRRKRADFVLPSGYDAAGTASGRDRRGDPGRPRQARPGLAGTLAAAREVGWMQREVVLDTETTGLDPDGGHQVTEVAAPRWSTTYRRAGPSTATSTPSATCTGGLVPGPRAERGVPARVPRVRRGGRPAPRVPPGQPAGHPHAAFDVRFLDAGKLPPSRARAAGAGRATDSLALAQRRFPGAPNSLDALCRRFGVDNAARTLLGALLDCELLAEVYLHLIGGRQTALGLDRPGAGAVGRGVARVPARHGRTRPRPRSWRRTWPS